MRRLTQPWAGVALALTLALAPGAAMAHPGHGGAGLVAGLVHPLTGADHLLAMVMVGMGAALLAGRRGWIAPVAFLAGAALGFATYRTLPVTVQELGIAASLVVLGLAVALRLSGPAPLMLPAIAAFGYAHGAAHGMESPQGALPLVFAAGFMATSAALHIGGYVLARRLPLPALRLLGAGSAGLGLVLAGIA